MISFYPRLPKMAHVKNTAIMNCHPLFVFAGPFLLTDLNKVREDNETKPGEKQSQKTIIHFR